MWAHESDLVWVCARVQAAHMWSQEQCVSRSHAATSSSCTQVTRPPCLELVWASMESLSLLSGDTEMKSTLAGDLALESRRHRPKRKGKTEWTQLVLILSPMVHSPHKAFCTPSTSAQTEVGPPNYCHSCPTLTSHGPPRPCPATWGGWLLFTFSGAAHLQQAPISPAAVCSPAPQHGHYMIREYIYWSTLDLRRKGDTRSKYLFYWVNSTPSKLKTFFVQGIMNGNLHLFKKFW